MRPVIYVSGKMSATYVKDGKNTTNINMPLDKKAVQRGHEIGVKLFEIGYAVHNPYWLIKPLENISCSWEDFLDKDLSIVDKCDVVFATPRWKTSRGAKAEVEYALQHNIPVIYTLKEAKEFYNNFSNKPKNKRLSKFFDSLLESGKLMVLPKQ